MSNIYQSIFVPLNKLDEANTIGTNYEGYENTFRRELTTDSSHIPPATHKGGAGPFPEDMINELKEIPEIFCSNLYWVDALEAAHLYTVEYPEDL